MQPMTLFYMPQDDGMWIYSKFSSLIVVCLLIVSPYILAVAIYGPADSQQMYVKGEGLHAKQPINSILLSWDAPVAREDGTPLSLAEIKGYVLQYWRDPANVTSLSLPVVTSYYLFDLPTGVYTMHIATVDTDNVQGNFSSTVSVRVD